MRGRPGGKVILGSCMSILVHVILPNDPESNLVILWAEIQIIYEELQIPENKRFTCLRMSMFAKARGAQTH